MFKFFFLLMPLAAMMVTLVELNAVENLEVSDYEALVENAATQFAGWVKGHPEGVAVLPTGKLGTDFIRHLENKSLISGKLKLVQQDEYYPFQHSKRKDFLTNQYLPLLGISSENLLLLEGRTPEEIEKQIASWGGVGFFLSEMDLEGNIGFIKTKKTSIVPLTYSQAAQYAKDFGGIEHSRGMSVITLGLDTVFNEKDAQIILFAQGESRGEYVAQIIETNRYSNAKFLLTEGAACCLESRKADLIKDKNWSDITDAEVDDIVIDIALKKNSEVLKLDESDFLNHQAGRVLLGKYSGSLKSLLAQVRNRIIAKVEKGIELPKGKNILHTSPHHDDIMLSYHPVLKTLERDNANEYAYFTSGYNAVTDTFMLKMLYERPEHEFIEYNTEIFKMSSQQLIDQFIEASARDNEKEMNHWENLHFLQNASIVFGASDPKTLRDQIHWLKLSYFPSKKPGAPDTDAVSVMKGAVRETESERMLLAIGAEKKRVHHLRLPFYGGNPISDKDINQVADLYDRFQPDVITLALDPKSTGPDTHYKVLQINAKALQASSLSPKVWGYRNVWHRFNIADASIMTPVTNQEMGIMNHAFTCCFTTQKHASFPAHNFDGTFSGLAEKIQREQYQQLKTLLGNGFFSNHPNPAIKNASGFVFIKEMSKEEFLHNYQGDS